jgi:hypothetical protein
MDLFGTNVRPRILPEQSKFFASFLGVPAAKLVYLGPDPRAIVINQPPPTAQNGQVITTAFADCAPYLLVTEESFKDVNDQLEKKLDIIRFRPNIVVRGTNKPWDEDDWKEISVGEIGRVHVVARCPRCQLPKYSPFSIVFVGMLNCSVDLETGVKDPHQPYKTLSKYRRIDPGAKYSPCFGMLCVTDKLGMSSISNVADVRWDYCGWRYS